MSIVISVISSLSVSTNMFICFSSKTLICIFLLFPDIETTVTAPLDSNPRVSISQKPPNDNRPIVSTTDFCLRQRNKSYSSGSPQFYPLNLWKHIHAPSLARIAQMPLFQAIFPPLISFSGQRYDCLHMFSVWKHIDWHDTSDLIMVLQIIQISIKRNGIAGNINDLLRIHSDH